MSEPIPESIPTSADPRSKRPLKRRALTPVSEQAAQIDHLFKDPAKEIRIPSLSRQRTTASLPPPPEIVANVQGSSAGAGSGEFHVYKASRRREYERLRLMQEELEREKADAEFERTRADVKRRDEEKTDKNRKKREKRKAAKNKKVSGNGRDNRMQLDTPETKTKARTGIQPQENHSSMLESPEENAYEEPGVIIHAED